MENKLSGYTGGMAKLPEDPCSIARTLGVVGERWTFLILREAFLGASRFAEFRDRLGVAPDVLSDRLATLVEFGVMSREPYREPGARSRFAYRLTPAGRRTPGGAQRAAAVGGRVPAPARGPDHAPPDPRHRLPGPGRLPGRAGPRGRARPTSPSSRPAPTALYFQDFCVRVSGFWRCVTGGSRLRPAFRCGRERDEAPAMTLGVESRPASHRSLVACEFCHARRCPVHSRR